MKSTKDVGNHRQNNSSQNIRHGQKGLQGAGQEELTSYEDLGESHIGSSYDTPLRPDAFVMDDNQKVTQITQHFERIMHILGLDLTDDSLKGTPHRVAKMYVKEIFQGLNPANKPNVTLFDNKYGYNEMLIEKDITFHSNCEHHFVPIMGKVHVAYIPNKKVIGLSKINRLVQYYAQRPQVQERLTVQIAKELQTSLATEDVAVLIEADHACVITRGIKDVQSSTITAKWSGKFMEEATRKEFLQLIRSGQKVS